MSDKLRRILILAGVSVAGGLIVGFGSFYAVYPKTATDKSDPVILVDNNDQATEEDITDEGETRTDQSPPTEENATFAIGNPVWLDTPESVKIDNVFSEKSYASDLNIKYYKVGAVNSHDIIYASIPPDFPSNNFLVMFIKKDSSSYVLIKNYSKDIFIGENKKIYSSIPKLSSKITMDTKVSYSELNYHETILVNGVSLTNKDESKTLFPEVGKVGYSQGGTMELYKNVSEGRLYIRTVDKGTGFAISHFVLELPDTTTLVYQLEPDFLTSSSVPKVTWLDGVSNTDSYRVDGFYSCGHAYSLAVMNDPSLSNYVHIGTTKNGDPVYGFSSSNNPTLKSLYYQYASKTGKEGGKLRSGVISLQSYWQKHAVFVYKDKLGRLVLFSSLKYGPDAECGKPVIYLYPTKPTQVSVKVVADITKSDPSYSNGWNVLAMPNSSLFNGVKSYPYLFWEGTGDIYPTIDSGFVIKRPDLVSTINSQLKQLGLNEKESADFMEFWQPKLPTTPYTRVTWFGTRQMDLLAPLHISPRPDTVIRIFMDFEGLDKPINIPSQRLAAPQRKGFTVVEWGGLLKTPGEIEKAQ